MRKMVETMQPKLENQIVVQEVDKSKKAVKKNREEEKKKNYRNKKEIRPN